LRRRLIVLEPLPRLMVFNASFLISREEHNNWLYLNRVNIFYSIFILMRFKSLFKNFPNCGWFWIKTHLRFWAKKTCIVVSAFGGNSTYCILILKYKIAQFYLGSWKFRKFKDSKSWSNIRILLISEIPRRIPIYMMAT